MYCPGTERARGLAQTLLSVPYGEGDGEKLDVYIPKTNSLGMDTLLRCRSADASLLLMSNSLHPHSFRRQPCYLPTWRLLAVSQVQPHPMKGVFRIFRLSFQQSYFYIFSKEESGFMAVPLIDKGVVVVAVGYDIAPKGRVMSCLAVLFLLLGKEG